MSYNYYYYSDSVGSLFSDSRWEGSDTAECGIVVKLFYCTVCAVGRVSLVYVTMTVCAIFVNGGMQ